MSFGPNMMKARLALGMNKSQLAKKVGCSRQHITTLETESSGPSLQMALSIAKALETDVYVLSGEKQ